MKIVLYFCLHTLYEEKNIENLIFSLLNKTPEYDFSTQNFEKFNFQKDNTYMHKSV